MADENFTATTKGEIRPKIHKHTGASYESLGRCIIICYNPSEKCPRKELTFNNVEEVWNQLEKRCQRNVCDAYTIHYINSR